MDGIPVMFFIRSELMDAATCYLCAVELNGIMRPADDPFWYGEGGCEAHYGCRFDLVPVMGGIESVIDITPDEAMPFVVRHLRTLMPISQATAAAEGLFALSAEDVILGTGLTLEDLAMIETNEEMLAMLFMGG